MKQLTIKTIVDYFTDTTNCSEEYTNYICSCVKLFGFDHTVPVELQSLVNLYVYAEPGETARHWYNEVLEYIGYEAD